MIYDLLYEKERTIVQEGLNEPEYFESEKYYTMGPGIDFPMIMSYKDSENPNFKAYFYFLNGHRDVVYFADTNFTEDQIESYEYNPWGILLTSANKNNFLYTAREFDFDIGAYIDNYRIYYPYLGILFFIGKPTVGGYFAKNNVYIKRLFSSLYNFQTRAGDYIDPKGTDPASIPPDEPCCFNPETFDNCYTCCTKQSTCRACCIQINIGCLADCYYYCTIVGGLTTIAGFLDIFVAILGPAANYACLQGCKSSCNYSYDFCKNQCNLITYK